MTTTEFLDQMRVHPVYGFLFHQWGPAGMQATGGLTDRQQRQTDQPPGDVGIGAVSAVLRGEWPRCSALRPLEAECHGGSAASTPDSPSGHPSQWLLPPVVHWSAGPSSHHPTRGMTLVGLARARQLLNRQELSPQTIDRMVSYFARHEVDKQGSSWGTYGMDRQAWDG
jgi:hypothetical protein